MTGTVDETRLGSVILARVGAGGAAGTTMAEVRRDLAGLLAHRLSPGEWRAAAEAGVSRLTSQGLLATQKSRLGVTPAGREALAGYLGRPLPASAVWVTVRDTWLSARALGLHTAPAARIRSLAKAVGLRAAILDAHFQLALSGQPTSAQIRHALAARAAGDHRTRPADGERTLAHRLLRYPLPLRTDREIIAGLAAEAVGASATDAKSLRLAVLRQLFVNQSAPPLAAEAIPGGTEPATQPATTTLVATESTKATGLAACDLPVFARCVLSAARHTAEGWPGNRKAFISHVWQSIRETEIGDAVSETVFKSRLAEAHRAGFLKLTNADIRDKSRIGDIAASAVTYMNADWHYVRVEE